MRKYQKTQCLQTLTLLKKAHAEILSYIEKGRIEEARALLSECQQGAVAVGTKVEEAEGEGTGTVCRLEEYCEAAYRWHEELKPARGFRKKLDFLLRKAEENLENEISTQIEAVFLPYKASMWDSLESVWRAASEDPDCTAVVVPIPYYDKNPDGSFAGQHYEGADFPADVPVVNFQEYDFGRRHPDLIFIHNPYDDGNYVTSVHPFFFSKNLKNHTDYLVYIPYFVLGEIDPEDRAAVKGMEHFCTTAGVLNADYVIVQSEAMRRIYVDVLSRYVGEDTRGYWEKKILGLGSPKEDRVTALKKEDFELPEDWRKRIERSDGSRKKVIFYNTSVGSLLNQGEAMLAKMEANFRIFEEEKEEVVLLWRPHPLIEATLRSMRPDLWERYVALVAEYRRAAFGIYDDSPDMYRAIAVSDGYYGDPSSVVWLYQKTGKSVMIQNCQV